MLSPNGHVFSSDKCSVYLSPATKREREREREGGQTDRQTETETEDVKLTYEIQVDSFSRSPMESLKCFEISVHRHIRYAEMRGKNKLNIHISQMNM